jgi:multidrug resistance efflux pump
MRVFVVLGLLAMVVCTAGALFALQSNDTGARATAPPPKPTTPTTGGIVCYGNVDVEPGLTMLYSLQPGRVVEVVAHDYQPVTKDAVLFRVDDRLAKQRLVEAQADLDAAEATLIEAKKGADQKTAKVAQQHAAIEAAQARVAAAKHKLERAQNLEQIKQANAMEVAAAADLVREAEAGEKAEKARMQELELLDPAIQVTRAEQDLIAKRARLAQAQLAVDEHTIKAPSDGVPLQVLVNVGSVLGGQAQSPAVIFCPAGPKIVRAEVEQEFAGRLLPGQMVTIHDERSSGAGWTGKVTRIGDWYSFGRRQAPDPFHLAVNEVRTLECIITLEPSTNAPPRLGQRVRVVTTAPTGGAS